MSPLTIVLLTLTLIASFFIWKKIITSPKSERMLDFDVQGDSVDDLGRDAKRAKRKLKQRAETLTKDVKRTKEQIKKAKDLSR